LAGLDFGVGADGADGCAPGFSGAAEGWIVVMLMVRVLSRPSRPKPISMPIDYTPLPQKSGLWLACRFACRASQETPDR
jgi:hypothetical protein